LHVLKNLLTNCFKGAIRQNELVELALTHQFDAIDVDMGDMFDRAAMMGKKFACQFFSRASIRVGTFTLPLAVGEPDVALESLVEKVKKIGDLAKEVGCQRARLRIRCDGACAYHENFENHRKQIAAIADAIGEFDVAIGLMLSPLKSANPNASYQFVKRPDELLTLAKMIARPNVGIVIDGSTWQASDGGSAVVSKLSVDQVVDVLLADLAPDQKPTLPSVDDDSFAVAVVKFLSGKGYEGTVAITGSPEDFETATPNEVASRLNRLFEELYSKAGVASETV
jgi:hypothetical protein